MTAADTRAPSYAGFKIVVFALLAGNTAYYLYADTFTKGLDAVAWFLLFVLYALETGYAGRLATSRLGGAIRALRLVAAFGVCAAGVGYVVAGNSLDAINTCLWIAVIALLELEVRRPLEVARYRPWFTAAATVLYGGLAALVLAWGWREEWLDAYDALLWLIAFATIEMDLLTVARTMDAA